MQENESPPSFLKLLREITLTDVKDLGDSQKAAIFGWQKGKNLSLLFCQMIIYLYFCSGN